MNSHQQTRTDYLRDFWVISFFAPVPGSSPWIRGGVHFHAHFHVCLTQQCSKVLMGINILLSSNSFKEQSAHVTSVKNILESHASYLMSGKELSKLVAFVKGTQFDLVVR